MQKLVLPYGFILCLMIALVACEPKANKNVIYQPKTASQILGDTNYLAICYGGYRTHTRDTQPTLEQIKDDLKILQAIGIKLLRTYNTKYDEISNVLKAITELQSMDPSFEMYVMLGVWIDCENAWTDKPNHEAENLLANTAEIERAVEFSKKYPHIVKIISVGNEAMVKWAASYYVSPKIILKWVKYLQQLKQQQVLPNELWITSSDNFASWGGGDTSYHVDDLKKLCQAVDFISMHTYPMHDTHYNPVFWKLTNNLKNSPVSIQTDTLMLRTLQYAQAQYTSVQQYIKSIGINKPIHIGETGWASNDNVLYGNSGSKACDEYKAGKYYQLIRAWTKQEKITCFYFEAFDEKWKDAKNTNGSENHFGLFTIDGKAKYAIWNQVDEGRLNNLKRDGNTITKTWNGNAVELFNRMELPDFNRN